MSKVLSNYIASLPKEIITKAQLLQILVNKIEGITFYDIAHLEGDFGIFKITDTLFFIESRWLKYNSQYLIETAYENMIIIFSPTFSKNGEFVHRTINIYNSIENTIWDIYSTQEESIDEPIVDFSIVGEEPDDTIENLIQSQGKIGEYLRLAGDYTDLMSFFKKLLSLSPIILPAPIPDFEGKIDEAFTYGLQEGVSGIQFIDIEPEVI